MTRLGVILLAMLLNACGPPSISRKPNTSQPPALGEGRLEGFVPVVIDMATGACYVPPGAVAGGASSRPEHRGTLTPEQFDEVRRGVPLSRIFGLRARCAGG